MNKFESNLDKLSFYDSNYDEDILLISDVKKLIKVCLAELLSYKEFNSYADLEVPEAWEPWLAEWFGYTR